MVIKGCPRKREEVTREGCKGCKWLKDDEDGLVCTLALRGRARHFLVQGKKSPLLERRGGAFRGGRIRATGLSVEIGKGPAPRKGEGSLEPNTERDETMMPSHKEASAAVEELGPSKPKPPLEGAKLDRMLTAVENSILGPDPIPLGVFQTALDLVEQSIQGQTIPPKKARKGT